MFNVQDKTVRVWLVTDDSAACVALAMRHTASVSSVALPTITCNFLVSAAHDTTIKLWNLPSILSSGNIFQNLLCFNYNFICN